ncbi:MAG: hypothetical protein ABI723_15495 [Bacteroidia bacterium]
MKTLFTTILLALASYAFAQTGKEIYLKWDNNELKIERGDTSSIELPFALRFKEANFKNKELKWKNGNTVIPGTTKKFGTDIKLTLEDNGYYKIIMEINEGKVVSSILGETNLPNSSITLEISGKSITFNYKGGKKEERDTGDKNKENEVKYTAGYIYYDAMALVSNKLSPKDKLEILESYGYKGSENNPYLKGIFDEENVKAGAHVSLSPGALLTNIGNTDVTNFAAGLARFLAERTKEELNEAFFKKMKEQLNAYPELKTAFPTTASFLDIIETYSYASVIQVLKEAFETDIQNLPENLYSIKNLTSAACNENLICGKNIKGEDKKDCDKYKDCTLRLTNLENFFKTMEGHWVALGMFSLKEGIQSTNPAELLKSIASSTEFDNLKTASAKLKLYNDYNITSSIELSNLISQSLVSNEVNQVWISTNQINSLFNTKDAFKIYLGLLLAKELKGDTKVEFYDSSPKLVSFGKILSDRYQTYTEFEGLIKNIFSAYNATNNAVKKMLAASEKSVEADPQALYDYYRTFTSSLKPIAHSPLLKTITGKDIGAGYDKVEQFLNPAVDIAYHISTKKYSAAIYDASILLSALNELKVTTTDEKGKVVEEKYDGFKIVTKSFLKYGTLISTVANAQTSEEVKKAIEASVLPVGSSSIKRNSNFSISVNAYVGGFYGRAYTHEMEYKYDSLMNPIDTNRIKKNYQTFGLYAPIGVSFNKGSKCGWGVSVTAQLLDLGALVNFYLTEGDQTALPDDFKIRLSNIFAPGVQLGINIPKTPLTLTGGFQYVPALYQTDQISSSSEIIASNAVRWHIGLVVDIPLYNVKVWDFKK